MPYSLKTSGLATNLVMCLAVDDDGNTVKEFVNATVDAQKTVDAGVTRGTSTWKGTTRNYFASAANGTFDFHGVRFGTTKPAWTATDTDGVAFFAACAQMSAGTSPAVFMANTGFTLALRRNPTNGNPELYYYEGNRGAGTTPLPVTSTKFSFGVSYDADDYGWFYGLESGSLAATGSGTSNSGWMENDTIASFGGFAGQCNVPAQWHIAALFNRKLTLAEMQSLHDDWFGTLFDGASGPTLHQIERGRTVARGILRGV